MKCKEVCCLLSDYLDGELNDEILNELEHHLAECSTCILHMQRLEKSVRLLKQLKDRKAPHNLIKIKY